MNKNGEITKTGSRMDMRLKNLKPHKKGENGGAHRPKGAISLKSDLRKQLENDPTARESIGAALIRKARSGNLMAIEMCKDWIDGKDVAKSELCGKIIIESRTVESKHPDAKG